MRISVAGVTDISDRAARLLGFTGLIDTDALTKARVAIHILDGRVQDAALLVAATVSARNAGATTDTLRNALAGSNKFGLSVAEPTFTAGIGGFYYAGVGFEAAPAVAGDTITWRLRNPPASGVRVIVTHILVLANAARAYKYMLVTPAAALPATPLTIVGKRPGIAAALATLHRPLNVVAAGSTFLQLRAQANVPFVYTEPIVLPTDSSIDVRFDDAGNAVADRFTVELEWTEEAN